MTAVLQRAVFGSDQAINLQNALTYGSVNNVDVYIPSGVYLIGSPLISCRRLPTTTRTRRGPCASSLLGRSSLRWRR